MPRSSAGRSGRRLRVGSGFPRERDWEKSPLLTPQPAPYEPELVSDGSGLSFSPAVFTQPSGQLDAADPAVQALVEVLGRQKARGGAPPTSLAPWRVLTRDDDDVLFGYGQPPELRTVLMRRHPRHGWASHRVTKQAELRSVRGDVRASSWRPDPTREPEPDDTVLRVLVTERTRAGGKRADDRLQAPDLHLGERELVLTTFVTPFEGFMPPGSAPETPARVALPEPLGNRALIDGALFETPSADGGG
jgi:hypothetical protein